MEIIEEREKARAVTLAMKDPIVTRTVMLRRQVADRTEHDDPLWQMAQFKNTSPRVESFRDSATLRKAMERHRLSAPLHLGTHFGHGLPRNPAGTSRNL